MPPRPARMSGHPSAMGKRHRRSRGKALDHGEQEGGAERWLVTYADMLTLLLVLFIVLFSMSVVNISKFDQLKVSLASAFGEGQKSVLNGGQGVLDDTTSQSGADTIIPGTPVDPIVEQSGKGQTDTQTSAVPADLNTLAQKQVDNFKKIEQHVNSALDRAGMHGAVQFSLDRRGLVMTVVTNALVFGGNSAVLLRDGQKIMSVLAPELSQIPNQVEVNGYTNQLPASTLPYPSGWELSSARASAVVRYLAGHDVAETRLSATGYSDLDPLVAPDDPRSVTRNRRVDVVVMSNLPDAAGDALAAAAKASQDAGNTFGPATQ